MDWYNGENSSIPIPGSIGFNSLEVLQPDEPIYLGNCERAIDLEDESHRN